jgi:DNA-directed RNA polymerase sigma subunit (sigma70/sigma32)
MYKKYKEEILALSNAIQEGERGLSVREIADKLGLKLEDVKEILSVAEKDVPLSWYEDAERFKEERVRASFRSRHSRSSDNK